VKKTDWSDPSLRAQVKQLASLEPLPPAPSFGDAVLNAVAFVGMVAGVVFVVAVLLGLVGL